MGRSKAPTPQELYKARKQKEDDERTAFLPPGLMNHGNTCFMNSVLQGLIATPMLADIVHFSLPETYAPVSARRSPQLTNKHGFGGEAERAWEQGMPLGDVFVCLMVEAWNRQDERARTSMSPKDLLTRLGAKYDQYLDFRQQDAHELLRHLLDAMRMEELDIIKRRQPPLLKVKRKRKAVGPDLASSLSLPASKQLNAHIPEEERLTSFVDMVFGGRLASILVCEKCKKVSCTYEDFNDLSLSIRPEDYEKGRRRGRLRSLARKLGMRGRGIRRELELVEGPRSSSVPASPTHHSEDAGQGLEQAISDADQRRRSFDAGDATELASDLQETRPGSVEDHVEQDGKDGRRTLSFSDDHKNWSENDKQKKKITPLKGRGWVEQVAQANQYQLDNAEADAPKDAIMESFVDVKVPSPSSASPTASPALGGITLPKFTFSRRPSPSRTHQASPALSAGASPSLSPSISPTALPMPGKRVSSPTPPLPLPSLSSSTVRPKSPRLPKLSREQGAYLRRLLADVPVGVGVPFNLFRGPTPDSTADVSDARGCWPKLGRVQSVEDCLRMFTAVEVLDGENMVGCRRCWKIQHEEYVPRGGTDPEKDVDAQDEDEDEDDDFGSMSDASVKIDLAMDDEQPSQERPASSSNSPLVSALDLNDGVSVRSAPTTLDFSDNHSAHKDQNFPLSSSPHPPSSLSVPSISMTAPVTLKSPSTTEAVPTMDAPPEHTHSLSQINLASFSSRDSLQLPTPRHIRRAAERNNSYSDASSLSSDESSDELGETGTELTASVHSDNSSLSSVPLDAHASGITPESAGPREVSGSVPRSKQVVLRRAFKRYLVATPPPVLVVHLKRFEQVGRSPAQLQFFTNFKKLDDPVSVPEYLDLSPFLLPNKHEFGKGKTQREHKGKDRKKKDMDVEVENEKTQYKKITDPGFECMYRLYAVIVHIGNMLGGHYIAYTALPEAARVSLSSSEEPDVFVADNDKRPSTSSSATERATTTTSPAPGSLRPETPRTASFSRTANPKSRSSSGMATEWSKSWTSGTSAQRQWCYVSDTVVRLASLEEVLKAKAYICMYERV
ncbi:hypothetical protein EW145_g1190 [Phellinidium pouzarii]|uniref:ubiquitinyl hydrolase 1 n=1 Tax=Phellinidium pouzarii TaxID=167371 RepID=A0A4S4LFD5_9AGAM|nr:hypothetical protein EW145_g1190 [Phellinidium pouzarii]